MATEQLKIVISAESKVKGALNKVKSSIKDVGRTSKKATKSTAGFAKSLKLLGGAAIVAAAARLGKAVLSAASDLEEGQSKFNVVFRDVAVEANIWADKVGLAMGKSKQALLETASSMGDILKPLGFTGDEAFRLSKAMTLLAVDVDSFTNATARGINVERSFQAAITGERESLKSLGIVINEADVKGEAFRLGLWKQGEQLSKTDKALATTSLIYASTADAQGDLARTSDSFANQTKLLESQVDNFKASLGTGLIPVVLDFLAIIGPTLSAVMGEADESIKDTTDSLTIMGGVAAGITVVVEAFRMGLKTIGFILKIIGTGVGTFVAQLVERFLGMGAVIKKVLHGDFSGAKDEWQASSKRVAEATKDMGNSIAKDFEGLASSAAGAQTRMVEAFDPKAINDRVKKSKEERSKILAEEKAENERAFQAIIDKYRETGDVIEGQSQKQIAALEKVSSKYQVVKDKAVESLLKMRDASRESIGKIVEDIEKNKFALEDLESAYKSTLAGIDQSLAESFVDQEQKIKDLKEQLAGSTDSGERRDISDQLKKEKEALAAFKDQSIGLTEEIAEARRRADLTDFERFVEDQNKKTEAATAEFEAKKSIIEQELVLLEAQKITEEAIFEQRALAFQEMFDSMVATSNASAAEISANAQKISEDLKFIQSQQFQSQVTNDIMAGANRDQGNTTNNSSTSNNNFNINSNQNPQDIANEIDKKLQRSIEKSKQSSQ